MKTGPTPAEREALRILAGCQQGSTEAALLGLKIKPATLDALVRAGHVRTWTRKLHKPPVDVRWYCLPEE